MSLCLTILQRALCGNYVNFGVFALYGDMALSNALGIALKLALSLPLEEMLVRSNFRSFLLLRFSVTENPKYSGIFRHLDNLLIAH